MSATSQKWLLRAAPWFLPVGIVALWQLASSTGWLSSRILPSPEGVVEAFWSLSVSGELWQHLAISSWRAVIGFSIGGSIGLVRAARAQAVLGGRDFVTPDDLREIAKPVLRHRVSLAPELQIEGQSTDDVLHALLAKVDAPRQ